MVASRLLRSCLVIACGVAGCVPTETPAPPTPNSPPASPPSATPERQATFTAAVTAAGGTVDASPTLTLSPAPQAASVTPGLPDATGAASATPVLVTATRPSPGLSTPTSTIQAVSITAFTASPPEIRPGEPVTLTWSTVAEEVTIWQLDPLGRLSRPYSMPAAGSLVIADTGALRNQISFVLFATSGGTTAQAFASAAITCPDTWFFAGGPSSCPASPPHTTLMQAEHFERGLMLWTEWNDFVYILFADDQASPLWDVRPDAWRQGQPLSDPSLVPPAGFFQPVRGFGAAWRDQEATPGFRVADRLGWATDEEFPVEDAAYQCDSAPKYNTCYITGPANVVLVLEPERSGWRVWTGR